MGDSNYDAQFKKKFNELDALTKQLYPNDKKGYDALRKFSNTLSKRDKSTLDNIIRSRHYYTHDERTLFHFDKDAVDFLQGLIDGLNRKIHNGARVKIDPDVENLRTQNLRKMGKMVNELNSYLPILNASEISAIKNELNRYIDREKTARGLEEVKKHYFDFMHDYQMLKKCPEYLSAKNRINRENQVRRENNLEKAKKRGINEIYASYNQLIADTNIWNISIRNKAKTILKNGIESVNRCNSFDDIDDVVDDVTYELDCL